MDEFVWFALLQQANMLKGGQTADPETETLGP